MKAEELLTNEHFTVHIGNAALGFAKVSNISAQVEFDSVTEGGRNSHPLLFRKPRSSPDVLTLEKGVRLTSTGVKMSLDVGQKIAGVVIGIKKNGEECLSYTFDEGIITKAELGNLDALGHEVLIKKIEISHSGLKQIKH